MLVLDLAVPVQSQAIQVRENGVNSAGSASRSVQVVDAQKPFSGLRARLQKTPDSGDDGAEMQRTGGGGRKAAPVWVGATA